MSEAQMKSQGIVGVSLMVQVSTDKHPLIYNSMPSESFVLTFLPDWTNNEFRISNGHQRVRQTFVQR